MARWQDCVQVCSCLLRLGLPRLDCLLLPSCLLLLGCLLLVTYLPRLDCSSLLTRLLRLGCLPRLDCLLLLSCLLLLRGLPFSVKSWFDNTFSEFTRSEVFSQHRKRQSEPFVGGTTPRSSAI